MNLDLKTVIILSSDLNLNLMQCNIDYPLFTCDVLFLKHTGTKDLLQRMGVFY
jgi:hypothetical protein